MGFAALTKQRVGHVRVAVNPAFLNHFAAVATDKRRVASDSEVLLVSVPFVSVEHRVDGVALTVLAVVRRRTEPPGSAFQAVVICLVVVRDYSHSSSFDLASSRFASIWYFTGIRSV